MLTSRGIALRIRRHGLQSLHPAGGRRRNRGSAHYRKTARDPILETADDVSGIATQKPKRNCREARRIPFIANDDDPLVVAYRSVLEPALWIQPPLQNIAIDDERAGNHSVALPLLERAYVNQDSSSARCVVGLAGRQTA